MAEHGFHNNFYSVDGARGIDGEPVLFELNGINSGMKGFKELGLDAGLEDKLADRILEAADGRIILLESHKMYAENLRERGADVIKRPYFGALMRRIPLKDLFVFGGFGMNSDYGMQLELAGLQNEVANPTLVEEFLDNKILQYVMGIQTSVSPNIPVSTFLGPGIKYSHEFIDDQVKAGVNRFVYKPFLGCRGEGIEVVDAEDAHEMVDKESSISRIGWALRSLLSFTAVYPRYFYKSDSLGPMKPTALLQQFRKSDPVYCAETGKYHSASARIIHFNGVVDGYWRLSPHPVDDKVDNTELHIVNLARNGLVAPMSDKDKELLFPFADEVVRSYETEMTKYAFADFEGFLEFRNNIAQAIVEGKPLGNLSMYMPKQEGKILYRAVG